MYRIRDWNDTYETPESRKLKNTRFVPVPNKHDGKGFRRIQLLPEKVELFCAWNLIVQVASKCPERGVLRDRDGLITPADLALKTGFPEAIFAQAYEFFSSGGKLAWLDPIQEAPGDSWRPPENLPRPPENSADGGKPDFTPISAPTGDSPGTSGDFQESPSEGKGIEGKGISKSEPEISRPTPKQEYWDTLVEVCGLEVLTQRDESELYDQCRDFRTKGATASEIRKRADVYRHKWPEALLTPKALLRNWANLKPAESVAPARNRL